jgi:hypothetical protein
MARYICENFRPVTVREDEYDDGPGPARIFANRIARREYGRKGFVHNLRLDSWSFDGRSFNYEAFVGVSVKGEMHACSGRNVWFTLHKQD